MLWIWHDLFRIPDQEKGPDPTPIILNTLENFKKMPFNFFITYGYFFTVFSVQFKKTSSKIFNYFCFLIFA